MDGKEIVVSAGENLLHVIEHTDLGDILKPLTTEIHLFDTFIAGTTHLQDPSVLDRAAVGDKLTLRREQNKYDDNAILLLNAEGKKLGYVPEKDNLIFARLLDAGKMLVAKISAMEKKGSFSQISVGIYLVDF